VTLTLKALKRLDETPPWDWPEDTATDLLDVLRDPRAGEEQRVLAAELAGNSVVINDELAHALLALLRSAEQPDAVRSTAAISLGPVLESCDTDGFDDPDFVAIGEDTFREIGETMRSLHLDTGVSKEVRRRILEASVRAPVEWHVEAIRSTCASDDREWKLTGIFCTRFVRGFDEEILASLDTADHDIHAAAVVAAGTWEIEAVWPHVLGLITAPDPDRRLLLAAIGAVGELRPQEAAVILADLADSDDPEIAEAVLEASSLADYGWNENEDEEDDDDLDEDDEPGSLH